MSADSKIKVREILEKHNFNIYPPMIPAIREIVEAVVEMCEDRLDDGSIDLYSVLNDIDYE
jgi:hypothetical protein